MQVDLSQPILDPYGRPCVERSSDGETYPITYAAQIHAALLQATNAKTHQQKFQRYELALKVLETREIGLTVEEATVIKSALAEANAPIFILGRVTDLIEGVEREIVQTNIG